MKHWLGAALVCLCTISAKAVSINLDTKPSPIMIRELHDGQWLAGIVKDDIVSHSFNQYLNVHGGIYQAWNAENGNPNFGFVTGVDVPLNFAAVIAGLGETIGLPNLFKPASYIASTVAVDVISGYRPNPSADVNGHWVYGVGAKLKVSFGVRELQAGL